MINFFRKTRKKMADDNRPIKYMRYAIGEIVLVVIGILIALSINNWNEDRKQENRKIEVTKSLALELNDVLNYTQEQLGGLDNRIESYSKILKEWETFDPEALSNDDIMWSYWFIHTASLLKYNPSIGYYNSTISSAEIKLIPDSLVVKLNYLYDKHRNDVVTYVNQEVQLQILIAEVVAKNHSEIFLKSTLLDDSGDQLSPLTSMFSTLSTATTINFLNSIKTDGELKSLIFRILTILKTKRFLMTQRIIPNLNILIEDFESELNSYNN